MIFRHEGKLARVNPYVTYGCDIRPSSQRVILRSLIDSGRLVIKKDDRWLYAFLDGRFITLVGLINYWHSADFRNALYVLANTVEALNAKSN